MMLSCNTLIVNDHINAYFCWKSLPTEPQKFCDICPDCIAAIQKAINEPKRKVITINTKEKYCGLIKTPFRCRLKHKLMAKPRNEHCNWGLKYPKDICLCFHCEQDRYSNAFYDDWEALNTLAHIARVDGENPTYWDDHNKDNLSMFES